MTVNRSNVTNANSLGTRRSDQNNGTNVPLMRRWLRTSKAIVMELSVPLLQMNFFEDHTKLIVSRPTTMANVNNGNNGYLVTYIDNERRASTYSLDDLRDIGCCTELHERLMFIYKVAKEFAELDNASAAQARWDFFFFPMKIKFLLFLTRSDLEFL